MMSQLQLVAKMRQSQELPVEVVLRRAVGLVQQPRRECVKQRLVRAVRRSTGRQPALDLKLDPAPAEPQELRLHQRWERHDHRSCPLHARPRPDVVGYVLVLGPLVPSMHDVLHDVVVDHRVQESLH